MTHTEIQKVPIRQAARRGALLAVAAAIGMSIVAPVAANAAPRRLTNRDRSVTATEVRQALQNTSGVMQTSAQTKATSDADSALLAVTAGVTADVPKDAKRGVRLTGKAGASLSVGLPNAASAGAAQQVANGVVSYPSSNGSANAVQTNADGSVRMLTVIDNPNAPTRYDYTFGRGVRLQKTNEGGVIVLDTANTVLASIDRPWAKDAAGRAIKTHYTINGSILVQHIHHYNEGVQYPVAADPRVDRNWHGTTMWFNKTDMKRISTASGAAAALLAYKFPQPSAIAGAVAWAANEARSRGYCLAIYRNNYYSPLVTWLYRC